MRWTTVLTLAVLLACQPTPVTMTSPEPLLELTPVVTIPEPKPVVVTLEDEIRLALHDLGRDEQDADCALHIFQHESGLRLDARGDGGLSFGLGQRHAPAHGVPPDPWPVAEQVEWFDGYATDRYGSWCGAHHRWQQRAAERGGAGWW